MMRRSEEKKKRKESVENLWETVLSEVVEQSSMKPSYLIFLGNKEIGKRSLLSAINQNVLKVGGKTLLDATNLGSPYSALDFTYLYVRDSLEEDENLTKINIFILDDASQKEYLKMALKPQYFNNMAIVIGIDFDSPTTIMKSLENWFQLLMELSDQFIPQLPMEKQDAMREKLINYIKIYSEPVLDEEGRVQKTFIGGGHSLEELKSELPLGEGVLTVNLGIPIVIAGMKSDLIKTSESTQFDEQKIYQMQKHIRSFALSYGASIIFTSSKQNINLELFYNYLMHRLYGFDFKYKANSDDTDKVFIPTGWDSENLISELSKEELAFEELFASHQSESEHKHTDEFMCEDFTRFLSRFSSVEEPGKPVNEGQPKERSQKQDQQKKLQNFYTDLRKGIKKPDPHHKTKKNTHN